MNEKPGDFSGPRVQVHRTPGLRSLTTPWVTVDEDEWGGSSASPWGMLGTYSAAAGCLARRGIRQANGRLGCYCKPGYSLLNNRDSKDLFSFFSCAWAKPRGLQS